MEILTSSKNEGVIKTLPWGDQEVCLLPPARPLLLLPNDSTLVAHLLLTALTLLISKKLMGAMLCVRCVFFRISLTPWGG